MQTVSLHLQGMGLGSGEGLGRKITWSREHHIGIAALTWHWFESSSLPNRADLIEIVRALASVFADAQHKPAPHAQLASLVYWQPMGCAGTPACSRRWIARGVVHDQHYLLLPHA